MHAERPTPLIFRTREQPEHRVEGPVDAVYHTHYRDQDVRTRQAVDELEVGMRASGGERQCD